MMNVSDYYQKYPKLQLGFQTSGGALQKVIIGFIQKTASTLVANTTNKAINVTFRGLAPYHFYHTVVTINIGASDVFIAIAACFSLHAIIFTNIFIKGKWKIINV
jgi:hypothetical protein